MRIIVLLLFGFLLSMSVPAQHCPYDGTHLIALKVVDKKGNMLTSVNNIFYLLEVDNPMADSCTSAGDLIKKQFLNSVDFIAEITLRFNRNGYSTELNSRLKNAGIFTNANMMVTLNQAENTCTLIGKSETVYTNYIYRQRKFVIAYMLNGKEILTPLPDDLIYGLCTHNKDLKNFKTVTIKL